MKVRRSVALALSPDLREVARKVDEARACLRAEEVGAADALLAQVYAALTGRPPT